MRLVGALIAVLLALPVFSAGKTARGSAASPAAPKASSKKPKSRKSKRAAKPFVFTVTPSPEIEARVESETNRALDTLRSPTSSNLFESAYLAAAVYYRDGFLSGFADEKPDADPSRRIVARISRELTPTKKAAYTSRLLQYWCENYPAPDAPPPAFVVPVPSSAPVSAAPSRSRRKRRARWRAVTHQYALDLFVEEGTPVRSATRGLVILADKDWTPGEPFSTTSQKGGNSVVVYDPDGDRFCRYAHLDRVFAFAGDIVEAGDPIATVGHTGLNASRPRHGHHLHFEVNRIEQGQVRPLNAAELRALIHGGLEHPRVDSSELGAK